MFEKEAKEYSHTKHCEKCSTGHCEKKCILVKDDYETFKDGAEFGYNKANEWHYPSKGELPPEDVPLLCIRGGKIYVAWYYNDIYHDSDCRQVKKPYAWKEIVPPRE